ncbi:MAG TPA: TolC family protein [Puia sp.]|jgi:outer membrane protein|nr:TolC family protein [Puia sp.]
MKKQISLILMIFFASFVKISAQNGNAVVGDVLTLKQAVDIAIKNNLVVEQTDVTKQLAQVNKNQQMDYMLPTINGSGQQAISFGRSLNPYTYQYVNSQINTGSYGISGNLILFSGLQTQNFIKQSSLAYDASKLDLEQQKQSITLSVLLAYLQVVSSQDLLDVNRRQADVDQKQLERLDLQNRDGALLLLYSLSDLKGQYASDLANIAAAINTLETAKVNLFQLLNVPYKRDVQYEKIPVDLQMADYQGNPDSIYNTALNTLPSIKSADLKVKAQQKGVAAYRGQYYPTLSLGAGISTSYSNAATVSIPGAVSSVTTSDFVTVGGTNYNVISQQQDFTSKNISFGDQFKNNKYTQIYLSLNIPILNYLRVRNNVKNAKINLETAKYNAVSARLGLQQSVEQAYQNMVMANSQLKSDKDAVDGYAESFRIKEIQFNEGVITSDVYLLAKNNIDRANINLTIAKYNYIFRAKILDYYQGRLSY